MASVEEWSVEDVSAYLSKLELSSLVGPFKENAVNGKDLLSLSDEDLIQELGCKPLQVRKIRSNLTTGTAGSTAPTAQAAQAAAEAAPAPAAAAEAEGIKDGAPAAAAASQPAEAPKAPEPPVAPVQYPEVAHVPWEAAAPVPVAIGVPAVGVPAGATPPAFPTIAQADVDRYRELIIKIDALQKIQPEHMVGEARRSVEYLTKALDAARHPLAKLAADVKEQEEKSAKLEEGWYIGKNLLGKKHHEEKVEEQEQALTLARNRLAVQQQEVAATEGKLEEAHKVHAAWKERATELKGCRSDLAALMDRVFGAPEWAGKDPLLTLVQEQQRLRHEADRVSREASGLSRGEGLMKKAEQKLQGALQCLGRTQMLGAMDMGADMRLMGPRRGLGSPMMNMMEMGSVRQANDLVQSAAQDIMAARSELPNMPPVEQALLDEARRGVFASVLLPGMGGDMMQLAMVRRSMDNVKSMEGQARAALSWVQGQRMAEQGKADALIAQAEAKSAEVKGFREAQMRRAMAGAQ